jgi:hypothetical protein
MKKILFAGLLLSLTSGILFQGCDKEQKLTDEQLIEQLSAADLQTIEPAQLPVTVRQTVEDLFFDTYMENLFYSPGLGYRIEMGNETCLYFHEDGNMVEFRDPNPRGRIFGPSGPHGPCFDRLLGFGRPVRPANLPESIRVYIAENYPNATIRIARMDLNRIIVGISGPFVLVFNSTGTFIQEISPLENCNPTRCNRVPVTALPTAIQTYISSNYPEATYRGVCVRNDRIAIFMVNSGERLILIFDRATGAFLFSRP